MELKFSSCGIHRLVFVCKESWRKMRPYISSRISLQTHSSSACNPTEERLANGMPSCTSALLQLSTIMSELAKCELVTAFCGLTVYTAVENTPDLMADLIAQHWSDQTLSSIACFFIQVVQLPFMERLTLWPACTTHCT